MQEKKRFLNHFWPFLTKITVIQYFKDLSKVWHRYEVRYKKIQKDMIFVPMPYYGISIGHIYNKKAGLHYCRSTYRGSGIAFRYKQQHRSPRRIYYYNKVRARMRAQ